MIDGRADVGVARQRDGALGDGGEQRVADGDRLDADHVAQAAGEEHARQGHDERLELEVVDDQPIRQPQTALR